MLLRYQINLVQNLMERAVVLGHGANQEETSPALASLVNQYASILAAQVFIGSDLSRPPQLCLQSLASPS